MSEAENNLELARRVALLEEKNSELIARIHALSEENRANNAMLRTLFENTPFGVVIFDSKRRVLQLNKAAEDLLEIPRATTIGASCERVFNCYIPNNHACPVLDGKANLDRVETNCDTELCHCSGVLLRSAVGLQENNDMILVEAFVDITPIKQAQREIENANQTKDNFLAKISHELRTPLNVIIGFTELLQESLSPRIDHEYNLYLDNIHHASKRLLRMVEEILDITRITANRMRLDEYPVDIPDLIQRAQRDVVEQSQDNDNHIFVNCAEDVRYLLADPVRLQQILFHLLDNACKFTRQGEIHMNVRREEAEGRDRIVFSIRDSGDGMTADQQARVFTRFEQGDTGMGRRYSGTGLGLTLCKAITELMGGELKVRSEPGLGSEFVLSLPYKRPSMASK